VKNTRQHCYEIPTRALVEHFWLQRTGRGEARSTDPGGGFYRWHAAYQAQWRATRDDSTARRSSRHNMNGNGQVRITTEPGRSRSGAEEFAQSIGSPEKEQLSA